MKNEMTKSEMKEKRNQIKFFLKNNIKVHIDLYDGTFLNGLLSAYFKSNDCYLLQEVKLGNVYVFFSQIKVIEQYIDKVGGKA